MAKFKIDPNERCGVNGKITFKGTEYNLRLMNLEDLKILDLEVKEDKNLLEAIVRRNDLNDLEEEWRAEVKTRITVRKRQLQAICIDFLRRKRETRPLEAFAFTAIYHLLGGEVLQQVKDKARELQELESINDALIKREKYAPPMVKDRMCGEKVRHESADSANEQIESMKAHGKNTRGIAVYGPCPFCGFYHVGHKPKGAIWKRAE